MTVDAMQGALFTHRNHYLFADYYLDRRVCERQEWREADAGQAFAAVASLWRKYKPQGDNEAHCTDSLRKKSRLWKGGAIEPASTVRQPTYFTVESDP